LGDESSEPYREAQSEIVFPVSMAGLKRNQVEKFKEAAWGVAIRYHGEPHIKVDVIIYDGGTQEIGSGTKSETVQTHFKGLAANLHEMERRGIYKGVKEISSGEEQFATPHGDISFLHDCHTFSQLQFGRPDDAYEGLRRSHTYLAGYKDKFVKVRYTYPDEERKTCDKTLEKFMSELAGLMKPEK
jgi:hypothetical protein